MSAKSDNKNTWLFLAFLLMAGTANLFQRTGTPWLDTLMHCVNDSIYVGLLLFWIESVRTRLLPSAVRTHMICAAVLMLLYMLLRIFKYRFTVEPVLMRYTAYSYWIPQTLIPTLFLMTCICILRGMNKQADAKERWLLLPACLLALIAMTNDLHFLVYVPKVDLPGFAVKTGSYSHGPVFYILYVWMILAVVIGLILLFYAARRFPKGAVRSLLAVVIAWQGYLAFFSLVIDRIPNSLRPFNMPESNVFGLLGIFEVCIRYRLIPSNDNYSGFFHELKLPTLITDRLFHPVYRTKTALPVGPGELNAALKSPVMLPGDQKLSGREIRGGYAFWVEDESAVHQAQAKLVEANDMIGQENDLIRAETEQKEKDAYLQSRHRIYHEIAAELYPVQKRISRLLDGAVPGTEEFRDTIAGVCVLNAYVKRKTNLLLLASEKDALSIGELSLALQESAHYLTLAGLQTTVSVTQESTLPAQQIVRLYDTFESLTEQLIGKAPSLMVSWTGGGLRLASETDRLPDKDGITLPVRFWQNEEILYMDIPAGKEAAV